MVTCRSLVKLNAVVLYFLQYEQTILLVGTEFLITRGKICLFQRGIQMQVVLCCSVIYWKLWQLHLACSKKLPKSGEFWLSFVMYCKDSSWKFYFRVCNFNEKSAHVYNRLSSDKEDSQQFASVCSLGLTVYPS